MKKYGRTFHLPTSQGVGSDDKIVPDLSVLEAAEEVVITEKMDGENTTIHAGGCHARSPDSRYHPSRDWMKAFAAAISTNLDGNERIVGEYLFAQHSIAYDNLTSYFLGFAWIVDDEIQSWDDSLRRFQELGVVSVPSLFRGKFNQANVQKVLSSLDFSLQEGFVVRTVEPFGESKMATHMAKYVRPNHVQSDKHWMLQETIKNRLKE